MPAQTVSTQAEAKEQINDILRAGAGQEEEWALGKEKENPIFLIRSVDHAFRSLLGNPGRGHTKAPAPDTSLLSSQPFPALHPASPTSAQPTSPSQLAPRDLALNITFRLPSLVPTGVISQLPDSKFLKDEWGLVPPLNTKQIPPNPRRKPGMFSRCQNARKDLREEAGVTQYHGHQGCVYTQNGAGEGTVSIDTNVQSTRSPNQKLLKGLKNLEEEETRRDLQLISKQKRTAPGPDLLPHLHESQVTCLNNELVLTVMNARQAANGAPIHYPKRRESRNKGKVPTNLAMPHFTASTCNRSPNYGCGAAEAESSSPSSFPHLSLRLLIFTRAPHTPADLKHSHIFWCSASHITET
ncbi:hypothetical protein GH733_012043 [Mirounga leonina]|nr:hypothetical protein GH733_012043 [Mirounga leonina]